MSKKKRLFELFGFEDSLGRSFLRSGDIESSSYHFDQALEYATQIERAQDFFSEDDTKYQDVFAETKIDIQKIVKSMEVNTVLKYLSQLKLNAFSKVHQLNTSEKRIKLDNNTYTLRDSKIINFQKELEKLFQHNDKMMEGKRIEAIKKLSELVCATDSDMNLLCNLILQSALIDGKHAKISAELCSYIHEETLITDRNGKKIKGEFSIQMSKTCLESWNNNFGMRSIQVKPNEGTVLLRFISSLYCYEFFNIKIITTCLRGLCARLKETSSEFYLKCVEHLLNKSFLNVYLLNKMNAKKMNKESENVIEDFIESLKSFCDDNGLSENIRQIVNHLSETFYDCLTDLKEYDDAVDWDALHSSNENECNMQINKTNSGGMHHLVPDQLSSIQSTSQLLSNTHEKEIPNNDNIECSSQIVEKRARMIKNVKLEPLYKYKAYIAKVPKFLRQPSVHPRTPNKKLSEIDWNIKFEEWKRKLKEFGNK